MSRWQSGRLHMQIRRKHVALARVREGLRLKVRGDRHLPRSARFMPALNLRLLAVVKFGPGWQRLARTTACCTHWHEPADIGV